MRPNSNTLAQAAGFVSACLAALTLAGCGGGGASPSPSSTSRLPKAVQQALSQHTPVDSNLVTANNSLGFLLFNQLHQSDATSNVFLSPVSIALALDMTYNGAGGQTQQAMATALQIQGISVATLNSDNAALLASLVSPDPKVTLDVADSLWVRSGAVYPAFINVNQTYYGATVGDVATAPQAVDNWVDQATQGMIPKIMPQGIDYSKMVVILANALYFKGIWTTAFDPTKTQPEPFTRTDGSQVTCQLMTQQSAFGYYKGADFQMVRMPYGSGRMSLIAILPDPGVSLDTALSGAGVQSWNTWIGGLQTTSVIVDMPRFTSSYSADLIPSLTALGMGVAFSTSGADFSGISNITPLFINLVRHATAVAVDEQGTTAAGTTVVGVGSTAIGPPSNPPHVRLDHPFFYAIRDDKTGTLLFLGEMMDPTATGT
jgi:serpin B